MNKLFLFLVVGMLIIGAIGFGSANLAEKYKESYKTVELKCHKIFENTPDIIESGDLDKYLKIGYDGTNSNIGDEGKPELPIYIENFILPETAKNIKIQCEMDNIKTIKINGEVLPTELVIRSTDSTVKSYNKKNVDIYNSKDFYPQETYSYRLGRGLDKGIPSVFVKIICYVIRYSPKNNEIEYTKDVDIKITYDYTEPINTRSNEYDLVIIAPNKFKQELQPLIDHKNNHNILTTFKSVEDILKTYDGTDPPEQIKYFIKDTLDEDGLNWGEEYVLLVGGLKNHFSAKDKDDTNQGSSAWYVPVRYTNIVAFDEEGVISDLYYADIYDIDNNFSSWDSDNDGIYAEWKSMGSHDELDLYPDVYIGRLPCRSTQEVSILVDKIINYESTSPSEKSWFDRMIGIGGKTFDYYAGQPDGEYVCDLSLDYMNETISDPVRIYSSNLDDGGLTPVTKDIVSEMRKGAGYVDFQGHGNPVRWDTIWFDGSYDNHDWCGGITNYDFGKFRNQEKLPIIVVGGCHNGLFNVSVIKTLRSGNSLLLAIIENENISQFIRNIAEKILLPDHWYWTHGLAARACFSWKLCLISNGGAIASTGCTGYGIGASGNPVSLSAELETNFFYEVGQDGATNLGQTHQDAISKFINENDIQQTEAFCITEYQLFGDPSLQLGGIE